MQHSLRDSLNRRPQERVSSRTFPKKVSKKSMLRLSAKHTNSFSVDMPVSRNRSVSGLRRRIKQVKALTKSRWLSEHVLVAGLNGSLAKIRSGQQLAPRSR